MITAESHQHTCPRCGLPWSHTKPWCAVGADYLCSPCAAAGEPIVNKEDADRIFTLNRAEWNAQATVMVQAERWTVRLHPMETGTMVMARDPKTGFGLSTQPLFLNAQDPPTEIVVGSYYPAGTFPVNFSDDLKQKMEAAAKSDLGPTYSVSIRFSRMPSPAPGLDVVEVLITQAKR